MYRGRSRRAFAWRMAGCVLGLAGSVVGLLGLRQSILDTFAGGGSVAEVLERMEVWSAAQFILLLVAAVLLCVGAASDRRGATPVGWLAGGIGLMAASVLVRLISGDPGGDHERLGRILDVLAGIVSTGLLGFGFLALCVAVIAHRPGDDGRADPATLASRAGTAAWQFYSS